MCGSSPRGRGTLVDLIVAHIGRRFIPAWAGNTPGATAPRWRATVHPRVGGEHELRNLSVRLGYGSSPRGRGTRPRGAGVGLPRRFIPAWAGNTPTLFPSHPKIPVHPRVGGEHDNGETTHGATTGSSPRGRGTQFRRLCEKAAHRFIPAWAGNTRRGPRKAWTWTVHPRVGGEHTDWPVDLLNSLGSSPRGRGTHTWCKRFSTSRRFIPAWAGNTAAQSSRCSSISVHPRVGGEHSIRRLIISTSSGSSPRGRGTPAPSTPTRTRSRFIPAWAGNTRRERARR